LLDYNLRSYPESSLFSVELFELFSRSHHSMLCQKWLQSTHHYTHVRKIINILTEMGSLYAPKKLLLD